MLAFEKWIFLPAITTEFLYREQQTRFSTDHPRRFFRLVPSLILRFFQDFKIFKINARSSGHAGQGVFGMRYF